MSAVAAFAPHLRYLRRYGRALTGSQQSGDAFVRASLEALLESAEEVQSLGDPKTALFSHFHKVWRPIADRTEGASRLGEMFLSAIPPREREALLLTAVEGFSLEETARILDRTVKEVETDIMAARRSIAEQMASRVLIIEDEPLIALDLQNLVEELGHTVVGVATTHREATKLAAAEKPELVLADIRLADGSSGIDAVKEILLSMDVPVIFITAFPERLLTGDRPEPTYLITKPFLPDTVRATIGQALFFKRKGDPDTEQDPA